MEAPEKIYLYQSDRAGEDYDDEWGTMPCGEDYIEYTRTDVFIDRVINFLNYKLDDIVDVRIPSTIIPHHIAKQELIEDFKNYMKGE
ncbi:hypothetical protein J6O48_07290 [bacterium]|nr:hypothetical protein [bacterium]